MNASGYSLFTASCDAGCGVVASGVPAFAPPLPPAERDLDFRSLRDAPPFPVAAAAADDVVVVDVDAADVPVVCTSVAASV